jgi:hypothetical protein
VASWIALLKRVGSLTCLQAIGMYPHIREAPDLQHRWVTKCTIPCYINAVTVSSVPADLNGLKICRAHLILDWLTTLLAMFSLPCSFFIGTCPGLAVPTHYPNHQSNLNLESELWIALLEFPFQFECIDHQVA